jgi:hypothetical protein
MELIIFEILFDSIFLGRAFKRGNLIVRSLKKAIFCTSDLYLERSLHELISIKCLRAFFFWSVAKENVKRSV